MPTSRNINSLVASNQGWKFGYHKTATEAEDRRRTWRARAPTPISSPVPCSPPCTKREYCSRPHTTRLTIQHRSRNERRTPTTPPHRIYLPKLANIPAMKEELLTGKKKKGAREPTDVERTKRERFPSPSVSFLFIAASFLARATLRLWSEFVTFGSRHGAGRKTMTEKRREETSLSDLGYAQRRCGRYGRRASTYSESDVSSATERVKGGFVRCCYKFVLERIADT